VRRQALAGSCLPPAKAGQMSHAMKPQKPFSSLTRAVGVSKEEAEELLEDPRSLWRVKCILDHNIVGEEVNKLLLFEVELSRYSPTPLATLISGKSATGKSYLVTQVNKAFPPEVIAEFSRVTPAAIDRLGADMRGKILVFTELVGAEAASTPLRIMLSERGLRLLTTDPKTREPVVIETTGCPAFVSTTTRISIHPEFMTRVILLSMDESEEQTRAIMEYQKQLASDPWLEENPDMPLLQTTVSTLRECRVMIPFASLIEFPSGQERIRRDFPKFLELIRTSAYWHQRKRCEFLYRGERCLLATFADYEIARRLMGPVLVPTLSALPARALSFLETLLREIGVDRPFDTSRACEVTKLSRGYVRDLLYGLYEQGFAERVKEGTKYVYVLLEVKSNPTNTLLEPVAKLAKRFDEESMKAWLSQRALDELKAKLPEPSEAWLPFEEHPAYDPLTGETVD